MASEAHEDRKTGLEVFAITRIDRLKMRVRRIPVVAALTMLLIVSFTCSVGQCLVTEVNQDAVLPLSGDEAFSTLQITDNDEHDNRPQIHNGIVTWMGHDGSDWEIFLYDGESTLQLTNNEYNDTYPQIHDGMVTWMGNCSSSWEIFLYDGTTTIQLTDNEFGDGYPQIHNGMVTWVGGDGRDSEIFLYDGASVLNISANTVWDAIPQIHNGKVTWQGYDGYDAEIFLYDGTSIINISDNDLYDVYPQIHNGMVTWQGAEANIWEYEIFIYDGASVIQLTDNELQENNPQIHDGKVIWSGSDGHDNEIFLYDGTSVTNISASDSDEYGPQIHDSMATWFVWDIDNYEIVFYDGASVIHITDDTFQDNLPQIHNGIITWQRWDGNDYEILLSSKSTPSVLQRLKLKLSGEFDFLLKEEIHLQLAALLTDRNTGKPISDATVTFEVYDPDGGLIMHGPLVEEIPESGVYVNQSKQTMKDMDLPKGMYRVHAYAVLPDGLSAIDMIQFHIDPPAAGDRSSYLTGMFVSGGALGAVAVIALISYRSRNAKQLSISS